MIEKKPQNKNSLYDLSTLITYIVIIAALFFMLVLYIYQVGQTNTNIKERGYSILDNLISTTRNSLQKGERNTFQRAMDKISNLEDVTSVSLYNHNYLMTYKSNQVTVGLPFLKLDGKLKNPNVDLYKKTNGTHIREDWSYHENTMVHHKAQMKDYQTVNNINSKQCSKCHFTLDKTLKFDVLNKAHTIDDKTSNFYYNIPIERYCINCHTHWKVGESAGYLSLSMDNERIISQTQSRLKYFMIILAIVIISFLFIGFFIKLMNKQLKVAHEKLKTQATHDSMTGLYNRRYLYQISKSLLHISKRNYKEIYLLMFDIDNFKAVNDTYGHDVGDKVIITLSKQVLHQIRQSDIAARWGGEEFLILLPDTNKKGALTLAEKIRTTMESLHVDIKNDKKLNFTVSIGVSSFDCDEDADIDDAIKKADDALYKAKKSGKNRVCIYPSK